MPHALVLVMLVQTADREGGAADVSDAAAESVRRATGAVVQIRAVDQPPADVDVAKDHVDASVIIVWSEDKKRVHLHFFRASDAAWIDRDLGFDARDAARERGRTIGFAIASMLPDVDPTQTPAPQNPRVEPDRGTPAQPPPLPRDDGHVTVPPPTPPEHRGTISATGIGALGVGGYGGGAGGGLGFEWFIGKRLGLRGAFVARAGEVTPVSATAYFVAGGVGIRVRALETRSFEIGVRADALVTWQELSHLDTDDPRGAITQSRFLPAGVVAADVGYWFTDAAAFMAGIGTEVAFGQTDVFLHGQNVATLVPVRGIAELGVRVRF